MKCQHIITCNFIFRLLFVFLKRKKLKTPDLYFSEFDVGEKKGMRDYNKNWDFDFEVLIQNREEELILNQFRISVEIIPIIPLSSFSFLLPPDCSLSGKLGKKK